MGKGALARACLTAAPANSAHMGTGRWMVLQRYAPQVVMGAVLAVGLAGVVAFYLALRPCVVEHQPGTRLSYMLRSTMQPLAVMDADVSVQVSRHVQHRVHLYFLGLDGDAALLVEYDGPRRPSLYRVVVQRDGRVRLHDGTQLHDYGPTIGYFDFNLLALPPGLDQYWHAPLRYAYPPPEQRALTPHVQRTQNGARPRFRWRHPSIEWVDRRPGGTSAQRYVQIRDIDVRYRFDSRAGVWSDGHMRFIAGVETEEAPGYQQEQVDVRLELLDLRSGGESQRARLQGQVRALHAVEAMVAEGDQPGVLELLAQLRTLSDGDPLLDALLQRWYEDLTVSAQPGAHAVQVATVSGQTAAQRLRWSLIADGYPAFILERGGRLVVHAGPFTERYPQVLEEMQRLYPRNRPYWVASGP